jgi:hypothetical protein
MAYLPAKVLFSSFGRILDLQLIYAMSQYLFSTLLLVFSSFFILGCASSGSIMKGHQQGLFAEITWLEGNQMPMITEDGEAMIGRSGGRGIQRTILIFPAVQASAMASDNGFFDLGDRKPIARVQSDANGRLFVELPVGIYSVFSQEEEGLWANIFDGTNTVNPVEIQEGRITKLQMEINYQAAF